jgi:small-conductance mechanosensitive channel/CRP-like cAMP-binding protein
MMIFGLSVAGMVVSAGLRWAGVPATDVFYAGLFDTALCVGGVGMVNVGAIAVFGVVLRRARLEPPAIAQDLLVAVGYLIVGMVTMSYAGVNLQGIVATSAVLTAVIGFSLQDSLGNVMGGLVLQMERTIQVGDWIKVDDITGKVKLIRWRQTSLETNNWDTIVIPNSVLMKGKVTLLGRRDGAPTQRRQWVMFHVDASHSPTKVIHTVEQVLQAETHKYVAATPKPNCLVTDFKNGDAVYAARYWLTDLSQADPADSLVRTRIYAALRRAGIPLAVPMQSILLTEENESHKERRHGEELQRRIEALGRQEFFQVLTEEERGQLAPRLLTAFFARGEAITRQGAEAHWLYIIADGEAEVEVNMGGKMQKVATLHAGDIFGEMGLMTGEPRAATVHALTDVTCYRLGKEAFVDVMQSRPEIAEQISMILTNRRVELDAIREQLGQAAKGERMNAMQGPMLRRIREFFGLSQSGSNGKARERVGAI